MNNSVRKHRGFTLIELLVVVAIIGLLASIILASLNSARVKGRDARRIADMREIQTALELYYSSNNHYPISVTTGASVSDGTNGLLAKGLTSSYISSVPDDPLGGSYHYEYATDANGTIYCLGTILEGAAPLGLVTTCPTGLTLTAPAGTLKDAVHP